MKQGFVIAIDGPVASGKGTMAKMLSKKLNAVKVDTGSMYRAFAFSCRENGVDLNNEKEVVNLIPKISLEILKEKDSLLTGVRLNKKDVSTFIRTREVSQDSAIISRYKKVRENLTYKQKALIDKIRNKGMRVVVEGRMVAFEVAPHAEYKLFLTASVEERVKRRQIQFKEKNVKISLGEVRKDLLERDERDSRNLPSNPEEFGYHLIDSTGMTEKQTLNLIYNDLKVKKII